MNEEMIAFCLTKWHIPVPNRLTLPQCEISLPDEEQVYSDSIEPVYPNEFSQSLENSYCYCGTADANIHSLLSK